jgi:SAM-dependent methyltransferase
VNERQYKQQFWDGIWSQEELKEPWANRDIPNELIRFSNKEGHKNEEKNSLDIGCGLGEIAIWLEKQGYSSYAFDISPSAIDKAKRKAPSHTKVNFFVHDVTTTPVEQKFDLLVDRGCFHDIPKSLQRFYVQNIAQSSKTGTELILFIRSFRGDLKLTPTDEAKYRVGMIANLFNSHFKIQKVNICDLSPRGKEKTMPGLCFSLLKI